jgi:hypothetical protein
MSEYADHSGSTVAGDRTWRLRLHYKLILIAIQALLPAAAASLFWMAWTAENYVSRPVVWLLLSCSSAALVLLARRTWLASVTLTEDTLIVRNVLRSHEIPLAAVTSVRFRKMGLAITSTSRGRTGGTYLGNGRHAGGVRTMARAITIGAAFWTGRRTAADDAADVIARAAGLPPLPARSEIISAKAAAIMVPAGLLLTVIGAWVSRPTATGSAPAPELQLLGGLLRAACFMILIPAAMATLDRICGRWSGLTRRQAQ